MVDPFEREPSRYRPVADNRNDIVILAEEIARTAMPERRGYRRARMPDANASCSLSAVFGNPLSPLRVRRLLKASFRPVRILWA